MGKSTISMAIFNSKLLVITRGYKPSSIWAVYDIALLTFEVGPLWDVRKKGASEHRQSLVVGKPQPLASTASEHLKGSFTWEKPLGTLW